jgi:hypothetical protein
MSGLKHVLRVRKGGDSVLEKKSWQELIASFLLYNTYCTKMKNWWGHADDPFA